MTNPNARRPSVDNYRTWRMTLLIPICVFLVLIGCRVSELGGAVYLQEQASSMASPSSKISKSAEQTFLVPAPKLAFPGAQGFGAGSIGGRGGKIIQITTLADSGPGSFRACVVADGPRVCVFRVSGVIRFVTKPPIIKSPFLTIAGETAPGDGIILSHGGGPQGFTPLVLKNNHDVIVRHIRSRPDLSGDIRGANDAITFENSRNVIIDHVSGSWARDENINGHGQNDNVTISWSIFADGLTPHDKCALLGSDPTGPQKLSFIGNLCANTGDRNPDLNFTPSSCVEIINNVFYNAGSQFTEIWESYGGTPANIVGNWFRAGPQTATSAIGIDRQLIGSRGAARVWLQDNYFDGQFVQHAPSLSKIISLQPVCPLSISAQSSESAYMAVLQNAGTFPRDRFDRGIITQIKARTGEFKRVGGPMPLLVSGFAYPDSDSDGMSDEWEAENRSNISVADSWEDANSDGLSNLESFLDYAHRRKMANQPVL